MTAFRAGRRGRAARIQRVVRGNAGRARVLQMHRIAQEAAAVVIQMVKNRLNHFLQLAILLHRKIYETKVATIVICQALYRGRVARRKFTEVVRVMNKLRVERWEQTEEAVAVKLQGIVRVRRARNRLAGMMEEAVQRQRDVVWATRKVQGVWKVYYAKLRAFYVRREMQRSNALVETAGRLSLRCRRRSVGVWADFVPPACGGEFCGPCRSTRSMRRRSRRTFDGTSP